MRRREQIERNLFLVTRCFQVAPKPVGSDSSPKGSLAVDPSDDDGIGSLGSSRTATETPKSEEKAVDGSRYSKSENLNGKNQQDRSGALTQSSKKFCPSCDQAAALSSDKSLAKTIAESRKQQELVAKENPSKKPSETTPKETKTSLSSSTSQKKHPTGTAQESRSAFNSNFSLKSDSKGKNDSALLSHRDSPSSQLSVHRRNEIKEKERASFFREAPHPEEAGRGGEARNAQSYPLRGKWNLTTGKGDALAYSESSKSGKTGKSAEEKMPGEAKSTSANSFSSILARGNTRALSAQNNPLLFKNGVALSPNLTGLLELLSLNPQNPLSLAFAKILNGEGFNPEHLLSLMGFEEGNLAPMKEVSVFSSNLPLFSKTNPNLKLPNLLQQFEKKMMQFTSLLLGSYLLKNIAPEEEAVLQTELATLMRAQQEKTKKETAKKPKKKNRIFQIGETEDAEDSETDQNYSIPIVEEWFEGKSATT